MVTLQHLIKFLPMDETVRSGLLGDLSTATPDQTLTLERICWRLFFQLYHATVNHELGKALLDIKEGKGKLDTELKSRIEDQVYMRFMRDVKDQQEATEIDELREHLKKMVQEKLVMKAKQKKS